jgi:hypothetical protein
MVLLRSGWLAVTLSVCWCASAEARGSGVHNPAANVHAPTVQQGSSPTARTGKQKDTSLDAGVHFRYDLKATKSVSWSYRKSPANKPKFKDSTVKKRTDRGPP